MTIFPIMKKERKNKRITWERMRVFILFLSWQARAWGGLGISRSEFWDWGDGRVWRVGEGVEVKRRVGWMDEGGE